MNRISVRGCAVATATAVTAVGSAVGVASSAEQPSAQPASADAAFAIAEILPQQHIQQASLTQQAGVQAEAADATAKKIAKATARRQAAIDATARIEAKQKATEQKRQQEKAAGDALVVKTSYTTAEVQAIARTIVGDSSQFQCFSQIVNHESTWNYTAENASSGAYGLVQALPGSKMASAGADWRTNPRTQIKWGLQYMNASYGSPCGAWSFWQANHWY
ncbi:transglycosylase SLT domain-containing protein [Streptomyces sp. NPDC051362]|uniref:aggregation-promoting factor C-terminal-like domain-containing protein n=1 Tax=Streptomyces sp. NPDC051362 TaxID=3365651 RepID=UPI0037A98C49